MSAKTLFEIYSKRYPGALVDVVKVETYSKKRNQISTTNKITIKAPGQYHTIYAD